MKNYRFILEPYKGMKTRHRCPSCSKAGKFTLYIDQDSMEPIDKNVGKCERIINCGYHYTPKQYFNNNNIELEKESFKSNSVKKSLKIPNPSYITHSLFQKSLTTKHSNFLIDYLTQLWDYDVAIYLANKYNIGTSKYWHGASIFWQIDSLGKIRTGKVMLYDQFTGRRVKKPFNHINWVHKILKIENFILEQCFFGEHLLNEDKSKPVAIVESEKTAIISSILLPEFIWLACGSANNLNEAKTRTLKGRNVVLFPDLGCYDLWKQKIPKLSKLASFKISDLLERKANDEERKKGYDISDYLVKLI